MKLQMGIVKIEIKMPELVKAVDEFKENKIKIFDEITSEIKNSISEMFNQILKAEIDLFLGQPDQSNNKKNGYYEREYAFKGIGAVRVRLPRDRHNKFVSQIISKNEQIDPRLKEDIAVLHLAGISNRTLALISKRVLGIDVSAQTVHNSLEIIEDKALHWLERPINKKYWGLFIDGTNFKIQRRGSTEKEPTLVVLGLDERNALSVLAMQPGAKDSSEAWDVVFNDLKRRGLDPSSVQVGIMDGLPGLENMFKKHFHNALTARCWVHAKRNALLKCAVRLQEPFKLMLNKVMYANSEAEARNNFIALKQAMGADCERAVYCIEKDLQSLLVHYKFDKSLWRSLKTTNPIERVNKELKRRTKVMEGLGENTLNIVLAFTAMKLEYAWQSTPVNDKRLLNLEKSRTRNHIEQALENLIH